MILFLIGLLVGACATAFACKWDLVLATDERRRAQAALLAAEDMLAAAETSAMRAEALHTPTGPMPLVRPLSVKVRMAGRTAREWARETFWSPSTTPAWAPSELASLTPSGRPPLRDRGLLAAERHSWPLQTLHLAPFPLLDAAPYSLSYGGSK